MVCFLMSENIVSLSRREQGAGERLYVNERLQTLKTRLNLTRPSNTLVWMVAEAAIPRIGVWCTSAINVEARNLPAPADFVSIFYIYALMWGQVVKKPLQQNIGVNIMFGYAR